MAAQRVVSQAERDELDKQAADESRDNRIRRKLPRVY